MTESTLECWNESLVPYSREIAKEIINEFDLVLSDARDERSLQTYLAANPSLLSPLVPPGGDYWCLDRPRLGSEYIPDFLLASRTSVGIQWAMIELESPLEKPLTKSGVPAKKAAEGLRQIRDWRMWLRENIGYARTELGLKDIDAECLAYLIIGRRASLEPSQAKVYRELSSNSTIVMTYDRLKDSFGRNLVLSGEVDG
ncbi:MAG: DUF4263 domain-containing protein [Candidatus Thiodiazotropha lotti]|nr:DUF4263 domain-containing protein [Candidatus Thiodiazotropha lotti]